MRLPDNIYDSHGYTILETIMALAIFLVCVVPLTTGIMRAGKLQRSKDLVTAACLLEQQSAIIRSSPRLVLPTQKRTIGRQEWGIRTTQEGGELAKFTVTILRGGNAITAGQFYVYEENDR